MINWDDLVPPKPAPAKEKKAPAKKSADK